MYGKTAIRSVAALVVLGSFGHGVTGAADDGRQFDAASGLFELEPIATRAKSADVAEYVTRAQIEQDLDQFQTELEERFAYLRYNEPDYRGAIQAIRDNAGEGMSVDAFDIELSKVLALFIDGHSGVVGGLFPDGYLPFRIERIGDGYIAFWPDRRDFVDPSYPYLTQVDGMSLDEWRAVLRVMVPRGSSSYTTYFILRYLEYIRFARSLAGLDDPDVIEVELESKDRTARVTTVLDVVFDPPRVETWPAAESGFLEGNIGYLRITRWFDEALLEINEWMPQFAGTRGLVIDIRDNRGGTRNILRELYPYFVSASDPPHVGNAAKYRLYSEFPYDYLAGRYMYRESWAGWSPAERNAISEFMETFEPQWVVPESEFSDWHFWLLSKSTRPDAYDYQGPIVFLMDRKCWSASDVILSSVKGLPNVTLIGEPSIGASGARIITTLRNSGLDLYLSSMASFQNTGLLFETNGVAPDWLIEPRPEYYLRNGPDRALAVALRFLDQPRRPARRLSRNVR
jgi:hypothetical protein